jgi:hypothetical protein
MPARLAERVRALDIEPVDLALDAAGAGSLAELIAITGTAASVLTIADFTGPTPGQSSGSVSRAANPTGDPVSRSQPCSPKMGVSVFPCRNCSR